MSVLLNNNSGLVVQGTSSTSSRTEQVPYGTATGISDGTRWHYNHSVQGAITLGAPGTYKFSCAVGEWTVTLRSSGTTTVNVSKSTDVSAFLTISIMLTCQASNGVMNVTGSYSQIATHESNNYTKSDKLAIAVFEPAPIALDLPQIAWNPRGLGRGLDGVGWYLDDDAELLCFADSVPLYLKTTEHGNVVEYYFDSWTPGDHIRLKTYNGATTLDLSYDTINNEYTYDVSEIADYGTEFIAYVVPILPTQAFMINNTVVSSGTSYIYTLTPYNITAFNVAPTTGNIGVDLIHHFNSQDLEQTLLTSGNNVLRSGLSLLKGSDQQSSRFIYTLPTGSDVTHSVLGHTSTPTWEQHVGMVDNMVIGTTPSASSTYYLNCVGSTVGIY